jgi:hypothetical protein
MTSKHFIIQELVPKEIYDYLGADKSSWLIDPRLWALIDFFRDYFGVAVTINDWHTGGKFNESGFRLNNSKTGAALSQHKFGRAADLKFDTHTDYEEIRKIVIANWDKFKEAGLTTIEAGTPTWLHVDIRDTNSDTLLIVPFR